MKLTLLFAIVFSGFSLFAETQASPELAPPEITITQEDATPVQVVAAVASTPSDSENSAANAATNATENRPEYELTCRNQAKEVAAKAYRSCITDSRSTQIEQLKKDYQAQIKALKEKYETEIKRLASENAAAKASSASAKKASAPKKISERAKDSLKDMKRSTKPKAQSQISEMKVELKPTASRKNLGSAVDESTMDIPEPIPVEKTN